MQITIEIKCPRCYSPNITRNGKKYNDKQNYFCTQCGRQFTGDHEMTYRGCLSRVVRMVKIMPVRGTGIRDISDVLKISITKVLKVLKSTKYQIKPKQTHYDRLEINEFWTYAGEKKNKIWLIYAYYRGSGGIVAYVWGKRDLKTAKKPEKRLRRLGISCNRVATDDWDSFLSTFAEDNHDMGKKHTEGIRGTIVG